MARAIHRAGALALALAMADGAQAQESKRTIMPEDPDALAFQQAVGYSDAVPQASDESMAPVFARAFDQISRTLERAGGSAGMK